MPYNGSGVFNRIYSWVTDAANGIDVSSTRTDTDTNDIANGLSQCVLKDGTQTLTANIPFSGFKATGLGLATASTDAASLQNIQNSVGNEVCDFRLTLTSGSPVGPDLSSGSTIYCSPYKGNRISLYDGSANWNTRTSAEFSLALGTLTSGLPYDVFCYDNSGVPTLEFLAWTNTTTRATALVLQNGVYCKTGALTRRYLGTFFTTSTTSTRDDGVSRYLWNYYNRVMRYMLRPESAISWNYTTATLRQANGSAANQLNYVVGVAEDYIQASLAVTSSNTNTGVLMTVTMGLNTTTNGTATTWTGITSPIANGLVLHKCSGYFQGGVGLQFISWNEESAATGTTTWFSNSINGLNGIILG